MSSSSSTTKTSSSRASSEKPAEKPTDPTPKIDDKLTIPILASGSAPSVEQHPDLSQDGGFDAQVAESSAVGGKKGGKGKNKAAESKTDDAEGKTKKPKAPNVPAFPRVEFAFSRWPMNKPQQKEEKKVYNDKKAAYERKWGAKPKVEPYGKLSPENQIM